MEITTEVDGITIRGKTLQDTKVCLAVEITHPYQNLRDAKHVPSYARDRESYFVDEKEGIALGLLKRLYKTRHFFEQNREALIAEYHKVTSAPDFPPHDGEAQFFAKRRALKEQLRAGAITDQDYEREIGFARMLSHHLKSETSELLDSFFAQHFPMVMSDHLREQVISILEDEIQEPSPTKN